MVTDHGKANAELEKIARAKRIDLMAAGDTKRDPMPPRPADPSKPTDPAVKTPAPSAPEGDDQLKSLSGAAFDRAYMDMMVTKHRATVEVLEKQTRDGEDAEIKAWAAKALPAVREHLELAEDLQRKLGSTSSR
jgi:putative membrane protein